MTSIGLEIGSVAVKMVTLDQDLHPKTIKYLRHEGNFTRTIATELRPYLEQGPVCITGPAAQMLLNFPYHPESTCLEAAMAQLVLKPDILLTLGGENFTLYAIQDGEIRDLYSSPLAARCSVYRKSDATHKLNKGECTPADICCSLIDDLAQKIVTLIDSSQWPADKILISGGLALNSPLLENLQRLLPQTEFMVIPESHTLEAYGAALKAAKQTKQLLPEEWFNSAVETRCELPPLNQGLSLLDFRVQAEKTRIIEENGRYILGIDAGSTTTKAVLLHAETGVVGAAVYLRTHGNPLAATQRCIIKLLHLIGEKTICLIQAAVTGSGRELVALHLDNSPFFNEILAHGRATAEEIPQVDTVFEIGGQDSKYIAFDQGIAVNYAMNDGCSAGTGSFIEESVQMDMGIPLGKIADNAFRGERKTWSPA
ncbi:MAG: BadF/BadG/BcrA/BcrD ATPase family protein [Desulfuromonadaceae bacterium]